MTWGVSTNSGRFSLAIRVFCAGLVLAWTALTSSPALAKGTPVVATARAQATVVSPLTLVKVQDLKFGRIAARTTAGTVTVNPDTGVCTVTGPILETGGCQFAAFAGMGARRMTVRIQLPGTITLNGPAGATMQVDTLTLGTSPDLTFIGGNGNGNGNGNQRYEINSNTGIFTFRVGGRLTVGANQRSGVYSGNFTVQVNYQ